MKHTHMINYIMQIYLPQPRRRLTKGKLEEKLATTKSTNLIQPNLIWHAKEKEWKKRIKNNLNLTKREDNWKYECEKKLTQTKINGKRRSRGRRWAVQIEEMISQGSSSGAWTTGEEKRGYCSFVAENENDIMVNLCLRRKREEKWLVCH